MTLVIWLAIAFNGLQIFPSSQDACAAADKSGLSTAFRLEYAADSQDRCCEREYRQLNFQEECKKKPREWGCSTVPPKLTRVRCVPTPSFEVEPDRGDASSSGEVKEMNALVASGGIGNSRLPVKEEYAGSTPASPVDLVRQVTIQVEDTRSMTQ